MSTSRWLGGAGTILICALSMLPAARAASVEEAAPAPEPSLDEPLIIAHRGASGYRPEHTLAAYELALDQGADCIETDLVATRDGYLVARHDARLETTTDVSERPEFADRRRSRTINGEAATGWYSEDFTRQELRSLKARERLPELRPGSASHDDRYGVVDLAQILSFLAEQEALRGRRICFYPELKYPSYYAERGLAMEESLVAALATAGYHRRSDPVYIQSFEVATLVKLRELSDFKLVQLLGDGQPWDVVAAGGSLTYAEMATPAGLAAIARYADAIGPGRYASYFSPDFLLRPNPAAIETLVAAAHAQGLRVHPYTFRRENHFLPVYLRSGISRGRAGDLTGEVLMFLRAGVDGVFTDNPDVALAARALWLRERCADADRVDPDRVDPDRVDPDRVDPRCLVDGAAAAGS